MTGDVLNLETEKARLLERDAEWALVASEGRDVERILSFWSDDAVTFPPGMPAVIGKAATREYVKASLQIPGFRITWTSSDVHFSPDGQLAYMFSRNEVTMIGPDGTPMRLAGRAVTTWRCESDGVWRCVVDIWNSETQA